jgi:WD40 repeat protein
MRSAVAAALAATLVLAGCAASGATPSGAQEPPPTTPELGSTRQFEQTARFGSGRAVAVAATETVSVIATTIGVTVVRGGATEEIPTGLVAPIAEVILADDGRSVLLIEGSGAAELWALEDLRQLQSFETVVAARFTDASDAIDIISDAGVTRVLTADGAIAAAADGAGDSVVTATAWIGPQRHAFVVLEDGSSEIWNGSVIEPTAVEPATAVLAGRSVGDPTGDRVVLGITGDGRFAGSLVSIDVTTGVEAWRHDLGDDSVGATWDVGTDGRVLAVAGMEARLLGPDGTAMTSWALDGVESVVSVIALRSTAGFVIVRSRGSLMFVDPDGRVVADVAHSGHRAGKRLVDVTAVVPQGGVIAADVDGRVRQWDPSGAQIADDESFVAGRINDIAVSADGATAAAAAADGSVAVLSLNEPSAIEPMQRRFQHPEGNVDAVTFVPDGTAVVSGVSEANGTNSFDDTLSRWDLVADDRRFAVGGIPEPIMGCTEFRNTVVVSPDGEFFVAPFHDFSVSMRRTDDGSVIHEFPEHLSIVWDLSISADGRRLATSSDDWTVRVWDLEDFSLITEIETQPGGFLEISFLPDGDTLVASDISGTVFVVDVDSGDVSAPFEGVKHPQARLALSPDGSYVAAGTEGGTIAVWETATGRLVQELVGHAATVNGLEFTPDGLGLVSGSSDGTVGVWRLNVS